jgi:hypothetical protein
VGKIGKVCPWAKLPDANKIPTAKSLPQMREFWDHSGMGDSTRDLDQILVKILRNIPLSIPSVGPIQYLFIEKSKNLIVIVKGHENRPPAATRPEFLAE